MRAAGLCGVALVLGGWLVPETFGAGGPPRPNVLLIAVDDLNDWVGCLGGHPQARTPNIDRLARRGTLFTNAHCQAPLCNPSRSSLLTGLRPSTTGIYSLQPGIRAVEATKDCVTLPQHFAAHGYSTFAAGKVFHDGSIPPRDRAKEFQAWGSTAGMPLPPKKLVDTPATIRGMDWGIFPERDEDQADWKIAESAIERLKSPPPDRPSFVAVGFRLPHVPCFASRKWFDLYPDETLVMPKVKEDDRDDVPEFAWYLHWKLPEPRLSWLKGAGQWRPLVRAYLASISFMDSQVGRVLDALEATGRADDTVVVLWSDHGWHLGEKGITGKNSLWERSTRVPLIVAGPGVAAGARCGRPVELLDLYPTLAEPLRPAREGGPGGPQPRPAVEGRGCPAPLAGRDDAQPGQPCRALRTLALHPLRRRLGGALRPPRRPGRVDEPGEGPSPRGGRPRARPMAADGERAAGPRQLREAPDPGGRRVDVGRQAHHPGRAGTLIR